jgi:ADP-ribose pyrophosphatase
MSAKEAVGAAEQPSKVEILEAEEIYSHKRLFRLTRTRLRFECFDGSMSPPVERINFERREAVGVLLMNSENNTVVLVRQFRYPAYAHLCLNKGFDPRDAWLLEIVAGVQDANVSLLEIAHKELLEEAGFSETKNLRELAKVYPSPGGSSELITILCAEVKSKSRHKKGGGLIEEGEDTQVVEVSLSNALEMIKTGEIRDAKTIIALQQVALSRGHV